jgi:endonuclease/exonuclease/phosphatase family metal-dependent hydrolase
MAMLTRCLATCTMLILFQQTGKDLASPPAASQSSAEVAQFPKRLKVLTFNVDHFESGIDRFIDFLRKQNADLIFLQEVPRVAPGRQDAAVRIAGALGGFHVLSAATLNIPPTQGCDQAILSRFPLSDARALTAAKGGWVYAVQAAVNESGRSLRVFSVHTHSTSRLTVAQIVQSSTARIAEISALLESVANLDGDVIVAGDFNAATWMPEYYALTRQLTDFGAVSPGAKLSFPSDRPSVRIDYFFGRGNLAARSYEVLDNRLSDHRPVVAELELKPGPLESRTATSSPS